MKEHEQRQAIERLKEIAIGNGWDQLLNWVLEGRRADRKSNYAAILSDLILRADNSYELKHFLLRMRIEAALRECPTCGKLFSHFTKRRKIYCSNRCAAKAIRRKRYAELKNDPVRYKEELKKARERNRVYYRKKVLTNRPETTLRIENSP